MSFRELCLETTAYGCDFPNGEDKARKVIGNSMSRMDESWESLCRTTLSVACVAVAASKDNRDMARELLSGMISMMVQMCDLWSSNIGGVTGSSPEMVDIFRDSKTVDKAGQRLGDKADPFLGAIMTGLLVDLPKVWSLHFQLGVGLTGTLRSTLDGDDESWAIRQMVEEQSGLASKLSLEMNAAMQDDTSHMLIASRWVHTAVPAFESAMARGLGPGDSLASAIKQFGFPNVGEE